MPFLQFMDMWNKWILSCDLQIVLMISHLEPIRGDAVEMTWCFQLCSSAGPSRSLQGLQWFTADLSFSPKTIWRITPCIHSSTLSLAFWFTGLSWWEEESLLGHFYSSLVFPLHVRSCERWTPRYLKVLTCSTSSPSITSLACCVLLFCCFSCSQQPPSLFWWCWMWGPELPLSRLHHCYWLSASTPLCHLQTSISLIWTKSRQFLSGPAHPFIYFLIIDETGGNHRHCGNQKSVNLDVVTSKFIKRKSTLPVRGCFSVDN